MKIEIFVQILISYENFNFFFNFWNFEIFKKFWNSDFFLLILEFWEILWNFWKSCFPFEARNGLFTGKQ